jgi:hypothetical protein
MYQVHTSLHLLVPPCNAVRYPEEINISIWY